MRFWFEHIACIVAQWEAVFHLLASPRSSQSELWYYCEMKCFFDSLEPRSLYKLITSIKFWCCQFPKWFSREIIFSSVGCVFEMRRNLFRGFSSLFEEMALEALLLLARHPCHWTLRRMLFNLCFVQSAKRLKGSFGGHKDSFDSFLVFTRQFDIKQKQKMCHFLLHTHSHLQRSPGLK